MPGKDPLANTKKANRIAAMTAPEVKNTAQFMVRMGSFAKEKFLFRRNTEKATTNR